MRNIALNETGDRVVILDQTRLPGSVTYLELGTAEEIYDAIRRLKVRGAPAIGICAAFGMYVLSLSMPRESYEEFSKEFSRVKEYIGSSRPTAVNLGWALQRMERVVSEYPGAPVSEICVKLKEEALEIQQEDMDMCRRISEYGLSLIKNGDGILTHCNSIWGLWPHPGMAQLWGRFFWEKRGEWNSKCSPMRPVRFSRGHV